MLDVKVVKDSGHIMFYSYAGIINILDIYFGVKINIVLFYIHIISTF